MRLMIVDNHPPAREYIRQYLGLPGVTVCECGSGEEALQRVREFRPHWVTVNVNLPGLNGFQTTRALRVEHPPARVVIVTGHSESQYHRHSREAGAVALINKDHLPVMRMMLSRELAGKSRPSQPDGNKPAQCVKKSPFPRT
ncbi:MAG TPA: response regulator transcription factor [Candidatus Acidoferrum sp.]|nr:response regulator transcription factor [Candidatus Acidoferrum sp.]